MGQTSSKTYRNPEMQQLKQLYAPTIKLSQLPGQPLSIQYVSSFQVKNNFDSHRPKQPFLELYTLQLSASQKQMLEDVRIYDQRKHNLPWIVKVICYDVERKRCECSNFAYKYTVCTQRVDFRLSSFKIRGRGSSDFNNPHKYLESFSFQQAVYVLINTIQGMQILSQQFRVKCPTAKSIGITSEGQVKVWINQNWALNDQSFNLIPDHQIIEQILSIVAQRTKDNIFKLLAIEQSYLTLTYHQIQAILSQFVIAFNSGKKSLLQRLKEASTRYLDDSTKLRKYSLKKQKKLEQHQPQIFHTPYKTRHENVSTERRFHSKDSKNEKCNSVRVTPQNNSTNCSTKLENTSRQGNFSQPRKQITFSYPPPTRQSFQLQSVHPLSAQRQKFSIQMNLPQPVSNTRVSIKSEPLIHVYNQLEQKNNSFPLFQRPISRKISQNAKTITITTVNSNQHSKKEQLVVSKSLSLPPGTAFPCTKSILQISKFQNFRRVFPNQIQTKKQPFSVVDNNRMSQRAKKLPKSVRFITPDYILLGGEVQVAQLISQGTTPGKIESINSITEQFRQLLRSDKKVESQFDLSDDGDIFDISLLSLQRSEKRLPQVDENTLFYHKSEAEIEVGRPFQTKCYSIKQVDEELSYDLQSNNNI